MGGKKPRQKGNRAESRVALLLGGLGLNPQRVPNSGSSQGEFSGDVRFDLLIGGGDTPDGAPDPIRRRVVGEVKARAKGWKTLEGWLSSYHALFLVKDRAEPLVVLPWNVFAELAAIREGGE